MTVFSLLMAPLTALLSPLRGIQNVLERLIVKSAIASEFYFALTGRMASESQRVLYGQLLNRGALGDSGRDEIAAGAVDGARYTLRRDTHRLEKGLSMQPRRPVFALDYIEEAVAALSIVVAAKAPEDELLLRWATDVQKVYFDACSHDQLVPLRARFEQLSESVHGRTGAAVPYQRDANVELPTFEQMRALAWRRRSVRWFKQDPVPRELVDHALEVGLLAPSACNRQPYRFCILERREDIDRVGAIPMGTKGFIHNVPMLIVVVGQLRAFHHDRDRHLIYIDASLAIMGFEFALETQGLSSCSINWPSIPQKERAIKKALRLASDETPVMLIAVGYPDPEGLVPYSQKKPLSQARSYDQLD